MGAGQVHGRAACWPSGWAGPTSTPTPRSRRPPAAPCPRSSPRTGGRLPAAEADALPRAAVAAGPGGGVGGRRGGARPGQPGRCCAGRAPWCGCGPARRPWPRGWATAPAGPCWPATRPRALVRLDAERRPLYAEVADVVVDVDGLTPGAGGRAGSLAAVAGRSPMITVPVRRWASAALRRAGRATGARHELAPTWSPSGSPGGPAGRGGHPGRRSRRRWFAGLDPGCPSTSTRSPTARRPSRLATVEALCRALRPARAWPAATWSWRWAAGW